MATEETELTFMRCPSCRSLVPAIATRCRMCGFSFEGAAVGEGAETEESQKAKSRVRQRTISASREDLEGADTASFSRDVEDVEPAAEEVQEPYNPDTAKVLESFSAAIIKEAPQANDLEDVPVGIKFGGRVQERESEEFSDSGEQDSWDDGDEQEEDGEAESGFSLAEDQLPGAGEQAGPEVRTARKRRRRRRKKKGPGVDLGLQNSGIQPAPTGTARSIATLNREPEVVAPKLKEEEPRIVQEKPSSSGEIAKMETLTSTNVFYQGSEITNGGRQQHQAPNASAPIAAPVMEQEARLIGWLVGLGESEEKWELRTGRMFIGQRSLREADIVINRPDISTPHCLLVVESDGRVRLQDLLSESGTLVKRAKSAAYEALTDFAEIAHGDRLRVGSYELVVCLIPRG